MKRLLLLLIPFIFLGCWIAPKVGDYEKDDNVWYCDNYDTMKSLIIPEINKTFKDWHWSDTEFDKKYDQYLNNIPVSSEYITHLQDKGYEYLFMTGKSKDTIQCYNFEGKRVYINGYYFIIIRDNGDAVTFFENNTYVKESEPLIKLPFDL